MTPGARVQAAIEILQAIIDGAAAERELTAWARRARYAGSKDRAAVRDHVYDTLRRLRSSAWRGGLGEVDGLADIHDPARLVAGMLLDRGQDLAALFTGAGHAPSPIDLPPDPGAMPDRVAADLPDWVFDRLKAEYGRRATGLAAALRDRAPVILRANLRRITRPALISELGEHGIGANPHPISPTAVEVDGAPRGLTGLAAFCAGAFELQDAGSQAMADRLPDDGDRVLDLCAGGGGKALALAARGARHILAHDAAPRRLRDLPERAARAGAAIKIIEVPEAGAPFDGVIADVPCSGTGSWRRAPEARWRLSEGDLSALIETQRSILSRAISLTRPGGWIAYMTCSLLQAENMAQIEDCLRDGGVTLDFTWSCTPFDGCDGFYLGLLRRL
ncbi:MAG: RsmB/NOP family class I SAM-dependent RNA methyltransferase [Pseudomonadota bacterium]